MKTLFFLFVLCFLTLIVTWPLTLHLNNYIIDVNDGLLITWFLNWPLHANWRHFYDANIFFPYSNTYAFSETMLPQAFIGAPFVFLSGEPLLAYNVNFLLGFVLTAFSLFLLVQKMTKNDAAAFFASVLFTFSPIHLNYMAHLQLFNFWPVVFAIYFLWNEKYKTFSLFFLVSSLTTILNFYFLLLVCAIFFWKKLVNRANLFRALILGVILTAPFLAPYYLVTRQFHYVRPINDAIHFSLQLPDLANVSIYSRLNGLINQVPNHTPAYFGLIFLFLILFMVLKRGPKIFVWLWLAGSSFILALGPAFHFWPDTVRLGPLPGIPLPYTLLYFLIPGFSGLRTPSRWIILTVFALCVAISVSLTKRMNWKMALVLSLLVLLEVNFPFKYHQIPSVKDFPPEQVWLKTNYVGAPIIQFPIYGWFDGEKIGVETLREYYSTVHWHPMFNGYSGYSPTEWENKVKWLQKEFPSDETVKYLRDLHIKLILAPSPWQIPLKSVAEFPNTKVYELY